MTSIKVGDKVRHRYRPLNGGLAMNVLNVEDERAYCDFFEGPELINKQDWFPFEELELIIYGDGGFRNEGE